MPSSASESNEDESLGYTFANKETRLQLELLDDLQKLGVSKSIHLPQLVVVGDQSTGKSSVLQAVTEIPFPIDDKMCTRFATEIVLKRTSDKETSIEFSIIPSDEEMLSRKRALEAWRPTGYDQNATLNKSTIKSVLKQAERMIFGDSGILMTPDVVVRHSRLSSATLRITREGPNENNFKIIDVPGLVRGNNENDEHNTAKSLVQKYLMNPRSIVVVVIDVVDRERQEIFEMLDGLPDQETRVIGVINKCDTKQKQSHDWVFDLIRNVDSTKSPKYLKEGWFGLRNRQACEAGISDLERDELERAFFKGQEWNTLDPSKLGRHQLKNALVNMLNRHIKKSIPELMSEIQKNIDLCSNRISDLGEPRTDNQAQFVCVNRIAMKYSEKVRSGLRGHYNDLSDSQTFIRSRVLDDLDVFQRNMATRGLARPFRTGSQDAETIAGPDSAKWATSLLETPTYKWIQTAIHEYRSSSDRRKANPDVESKLWQEQTVSWNTIASEALRKVENTVHTINAALFLEVCPDDELRLKLTNWLQNDFTYASIEAQKELKRLLSDEREAQLFSLQPSKSSMEEGYRNERIMKFAEKCAKTDPRLSRAVVQADISLEIATVPTSQVIDGIINNSPKLVGVLQTHDSLAAYYNIALYRFIDNFALQVVERHLLGPSGPLRLFNSEYVSQKLYGNENSDVLNALAGEDPVVSQQRADLTAEKASLEESRKKVQGFRIS